MERGWFGKAEVSWSGAGVCVVEGDMLARGVLDRLCSP